MNKPEKSTPITRLRSIAQLTMRAYYPYRYRILLLAGLGIVAGLFEGIGINAVIPLLSYLVDAQGPATDTLTGIMRSLFQFLHIDFAPKYLLAFIVVMFVMRGVATFCITYVQIRIASDYARETRGTLLRSMLHASWSHVMKQKLGHLESIISIDVLAGESLLRHLANIITLGVGIVVYLFVAFTISPSITMITLCLGVVAVFATKPFLRRVRALGTSRVRIMQDTSHLVSEHVLGMKAVKAAGVEGSILSRGGTLFAAYHNVNMRITLLQQATQFFITPLGVLYIALIFGVAFRTNFITIAALPAIFYLIYRIFLYTQQIQDGLNRVNQLVPNLQSVLSYVDASVGAEERATGNMPFSFSRELVFDDVHYRYDGMTKDAVQGISFSISRGQLIGIIGPSGSGKTTCVDLLLRLLDRTGGSITLDGVDARDISLGDWRKKIAYVSQDIFLAYDTIGNNIRFYDESITDEDIRRAVHMAHLDDVVAAASEGLNTHVGERGVSLSAGQRQRVAIARALARKPEILILDEATSALDAESETHIKRILDELKGAMTVVVIAHRLSTIIHADELVAIEDGRVIEKGSPAKLLKDKDSYFYKVSSIE